MSRQPCSQLVQVASTLTEVTASADPRQAPTAQEDQALRTHSYLREQLDELTARHALLMHATVLADAAEAAIPAARAAIASASQTTETQGRRRTIADVIAGGEAFMPQVDMAEGHIAQSLIAQRQLTRDALRRLFPHIVGSTGLHVLRNQLIEHSGLGRDAYNQAYRRVADGPQRTRIAELPGKIRDLEHDLPEGSLSECPATARGADPPPATVRPPAPQDPSRLAGSAGPSHLTRSFR
ncbi:hypothetical protein [Streptomyces sp. NBC_01320]|uniref:hypothetical protein n=1 Tax=Streptomyces sp. NBC_01320 TaxID=2903824 RepID=UPI002E106FD5|nr:hypothetical protein OG395_07730 [Streptomyces sp. NBC_01320]